MAENIYAQYGPPVTSDAPAADAATPSVGSSPASSDNIYAKYGPATSPQQAQTTKFTGSWSDVPAEALSNVPSSAGRLIKNIAQPFIHPVDTAESMYGLGKGVVTGAANTISGDLTGQPIYSDAENAKNIAPVQAVGQFVKDRYGSVDNLKKTMATDPVGVLADATTVLSGGAGLAGRVPGAVGEAARAVGAAADYANPINMATRTAGAAAKYVGEPIVSHGLGMTTGVGAEPIRTAVDAGVAGNKDFTANMRGDVPMNDVIDKAQGALGQIRQDRSNEYTAGMTPIRQDRTVLDFDPIDAALDHVDNNIVNFGGNPATPRNKAAADIASRMRATVEQWKNAPPITDAQGNITDWPHRTPEGVDALKQAIGEIRADTPQSSTARTAADHVYNAVKDQITAQAPDYADVMKDYAENSGNIKDIRQTLSLGENSAKDTTLRKLQSVMRNNVSSNYGNRGRLVDQLADKDPTIPYVLAGQAMSSAVPRGLARLGDMGLAGAAGVVLHNPAYIPALAAASPRLVGEGAYAAGQGARLVNNLGSKLGVTAGAMTRGALNSGYRAGQLEQIENPQQQRAAGGRVNAAAKETDTDPTDGQIRAGNYKKGKVRLHGLEIAIENPRGSVRRGETPDGKKWQSRIAAHYGYIKRAPMAADGDHVDVFIGPNEKSEKAFVIDQIDHKTGKYDEVKALLGFGGLNQALDAYAKSFSDGHGHDRIGNVKTMTVDQFKDWLKNGDTTQAIAA
jgi:hypothetical protein